MHYTLLPAFCILAATVASPIRQEPASLITRVLVQQFATRVDSSLTPTATATLITRAESDNSLETKPTGPVITRRRDGTAAAVRAVSVLDPAATAEAHQRDETGVRAFSGISIKTSDGKCLFIDQLSGDFRANLTPIQIAACGSSEGQQWDIITKGKHNNVDGAMLIVSTLTQACANFDPRRKVGDQVNLFSCGGRADGSGQVTDSQLFAFNDTAKVGQSLHLQPQNSPGSCLTAQDKVVGIEPCDSQNSRQEFIFENAP